MTGIVLQADAILLDTCIVIRAAEGRTTPTMVSALTHAGLTGGLFVSPVSAWEIGLLAMTRGMIFAPDPKTWFARVMARPAIRRADLTDDIALESSMLPGDFHRDPADRLLVATARALNLAIGTSDRKILDYARAGHVRAIAC